MSQLLTEVKGAVFFVDILGFGALTQNSINLTATDYSAWEIPKHLIKNNQSFGAKIIVEFREILAKLDYENKDVTISQLSDGAFVWSRNIKDVIIVAHDIMWCCINKGILCRGGLSCGDFIETGENNDLGKLILGEAVTNAVRLESSGAKGARIMIDDSVSEALLKSNPDFHSEIKTLFQPLLNPLNYRTHYEFKWYYVPDMNESMPFGKTKTDKYILKATRERISLAAS